MRGGGGGTFGKRDREHAVREVCADPVDVDLLGELERPRERAVAAFDLMVMDGLGAASIGRPRPAARGWSAGCPRPPARVLAGHAGDLGGDDVRGRGFVDVDRRRPGFGVRMCEPLEPFLPCAQIAQRIPGHGPIVRTCYVRRATCAQPCPSQVARGT